jgi:uncharacterized short protein YbdD (DUF466 family)
MNSEQIKAEPIVSREPAVFGRLAGGPPRLRTGPLLAVRSWLGAAWGYLRAVSGDDAYERYVAHHAAAHPDQPVMTRKAFFEERQRHKWTGVTRCC